MTRREKKRWIKVIKDFALRMHNGEFYPANEIFHTMLEIAFVDRMTDNYTREGEELDYVLWLYHTEYRKVQANIFGMKNPDATNPKI